MKRIVTFGEVMMRLSPPAYAKFSQATSLDLAYGGGEANVAISLAYMGMDAVHVTRFPDNLIGKSATQFLRHHWVDTSSILYGGDLMGKYFLEKGAVHRSSKVVYEREKSSFAQVEPAMFNWNTIFQDADWFHWTGITPAISVGAAECCKEAIQFARSKGIIVSADINSRKNLWNYGKKQQDVMPELIAGCDVVIAGSRDIREIFGFDVEGNKEEEFINAAIQLSEACEGVKKVFDKEREMLSASHNRIQGKVWNGKRFIKAKKLDVTHIVDRVGTGDAYAAGVIYGLLHYQKDEEALSFATAACALKHTVEGDANIIALEDVQELMHGNTSGKIKR
ncbi:2-dehydro-3-deoxygluconokinase [Catalinimonas alkaloidigena]|uniref:sugar kinase n=1 Tax=Catalinimonas alkaloidigena TaxID=1075417 RepID=UPI002406B4F3|nr:sugar kinase [Catalinimonas alkaloidigena]MDF9799281.1 2-dehydro-3-deoxygluconokinase [Catalinimonas alkaloidigena]